MKCDQCNSPALYNWGGVPLCLNCTERVNAMQLQHDRARKEHINFLLDQADAAVGLSAGLPRFDLSAPPPPSSKTFINFQVSNSVIGAINTGEAKKIDVSLSQISTDGHADLSAALGHFTQALIDSHDLSKQSKDELLEMVAVVSAEAAKPSKERKQGVLKSLFQTIGTIASVTGSLVTAWEKLHPLLQALR